MSKDLYKIIQNKMDGHPLGAPAHKSFTKLLKLYYSKTEADIVSQMELSTMSALVEFPVGGGEFSIIAPY